MTLSSERLDSSHIKQLLLYAPDDYEVRQYEQYRDDPCKLSEPDQFVPTGTRLMIEFHQYLFSSFLWLHLIITDYNVKLYF